MYLVTLLILEFGKLEAWVIYNLNLQKNPKKPKMCVFFLNLSLFFLCLHTLVWEKQAAI